MTTFLQTLAISASARAFVYGGEAVALEKDGQLEAAAAARRRYWREMAACERLMGNTTAAAAADQLGGAA